MRAAERELWAVHYSRSNNLHLIYKAIKLTKPLPLPREASIYIRELCLTYILLRQRDFKRHLWGLFLFSLHSWSRDVVHIPNYLFVRESKAEALDQAQKRHLYNARDSERRRHDK